MLVHLFKALRALSALRSMSRGCPDNRQARGDAAQLLVEMQHGSEQRCSTTPKELRFQPVAPRKKHSLHAESQPRSCPLGPCTERGPGTGISMSFTQREAGGTYTCSFIEHGWRTGDKWGISSLFSHLDKTRQRFQNSIFCFHAICGIAVAGKLWLVQSCSGAVRREQGSPWMNAESELPPGHLQHRHRYRFVSACAFLYFFSDSKFKYCSGIFFFRNNLN